MKTHASEIVIDAAPPVVWAVLLDTARWPEFDPFCVRIEGTPALGNTVRAFTTLAPGRAFPVKVTAFDAPRKMVWRGGMPFGLFTGVRTYAIDPHGAGKSHFSMTEVFTGPMLALIGKSLPDMTEAFQSFCTGLKSRVETRTT